MPRVDCVINSGTLWSHAGLLSWRAAKQHGIPTITYVRGLLEPTAFRVKGLRKRVYWHLVAKRILRDSTAVVALNERERESIRRLVAGGLIDVIPNGAALEGEAESRDLLDARIPELAGHRYVLFLGRIHPVKGIDLLLRSASELRRELQDVRFVVAGPIDRAFAGRWSELMRAHALEDAVVAPGPVKGLLKTTLLAHADVFTLPSYGEGLPVAALEALLAGCPVVVTRQCNLPEVEEAGAGIVIDPDGDQLRHALRRILRDDRGRRDMSANARVLARTTFDWRAIGERTLDLCRDVARSGRRAKYQHAREPVERPD